MTEKTTIRIDLNINGKKYSGTHVFSLAVGEITTKDKMVEMALNSFSERMKKDLAKEGENNEGF